MSATFSDGEGWFPETRNEFEPVYESKHLTCPDDNARLVYLDGYYWCPQCDYKEGCCDG